MAILKYKITWEYSNGKLCSKEYPNDKDVQKAKKWLKDNGATVIDSSVVLTTPKVEQ
jgi:hypothetical protein